MRKPVGRIRNSRAKMKNGATASQVRSWDDCPGPFTWGAGVGTGGTRSSGCADPISDEAVIGHPWSNQAKAGAAQGDARKRSGGPGRYLLHVRADHFVPVLGDGVLI